MTIKYIDKSSLVEISPSKVIDKLELGSYSYNAISIDGYNVSEYTTKTVILTSTNPNQVITFNYNKILGEVTISYVEEGTNIDISEKTIYSNLELGTYKYSAKSIDGYNVDKLEQSVTLTSTIPNVTIFFSYSKILGSITIKYLDSSTLAEISSSTTISNIVLGNYTYDSISIDGYEIVGDSSISITLTSAEPNRSISFKYNKIQIEIPADLNWNEVPYISTYYIKPVVEPGEEVLIDYYITDFYQKEYIEENYSETFTVTVRVEGKEDKLYLNLKAGDHQVSLGSFTNEGEQKFSIICTDKYGRNSHELFNFFLVRKPVVWNEYVMTKEDLLKYNIKNTDTYEVKKIINLSGLASKTSATVKAALIEEANKIIPESKTYVCVIADTTGDGNPDYWWAENQVVYASDYDKAAVLQESTNTRIGLQKLLDDKKAEGYNKLTLLQGTYRIDHQLQIYIPTEFTLNMNGATIKQNQFIGNKSIMLELNNTFDSHVINGTIEGDYFSHDYANSTSNSEWVNGINIGGEAKYSSFENLIVKDIVGYGSSNGIANSIDGQSNFTYLGYDSLSNCFSLGDINQSTGLDIVSSTRVTSSIFKDISAYSQIGYIQIGVYLGYQGNPVGPWTIICHFYDSNKNFIQSINGYLYRRIKVPSNSKFFRITLTTKVFPSNLSIFYFKLPTHCTFKNINHINCRCVGLAQGAMKDFIVDNCSFIKCGQTSAKCAYDAEDGWELMQDVTLNKLDFSNNPNNELLICAGQNFSIQNSINGNIFIYERSNSYSLKNNFNIKGITLNHSSRSSTGYIRINNNNNNILGDAIIKNISSSYLKLLYVIKNSIINKNAINDLYDGLFFNCTIGNKSIQSSIRSGNYQNCYLINKSGGNGGIYTSCTIENFSSTLLGEFKFLNCTINNFNCTAASYSNYYTYKYLFEKCKLTNFSFEIPTWHIGAETSFVNCEININNYLLKLPFYSMKKPIKLIGNKINSSSFNGVIWFSDDRTGGSAGELVTQDILTLTNNIISLTNSVYIINGLNKNTINNINIVSYNNIYTPLTVLLCNPDAKFSPNINIIEN